MKLIEYVRLLREHGGPEARAVLAFVERHNGDSVLMGRIKTLNALHLMHLALKRVRVP